jgi:hypothetical protein
MHEGERISVIEIILTGSICHPPRPQSEGFTDFLSVAAIVHVALARRRASAASMATRMLRALREDRVEAQTGG